MDLEKKMVINNLYKINNLIDKLNLKHDLIVNNLEDVMMIDNKIINEENIKNIKNNNLNIKDINNKIINDLV